MDFLRIKYGPFSDCNSFKYLKAIQDIAQPPLASNRPSLEDLLDHERRLFFPTTELDGIFQNDEIKDVLACNCDRCGPAFSQRNTIQGPKTVDRILNAPLTTILAILIYLGHSFLIKALVAIDHKVYDKSLDSLQFHLKAPENKREWIDLMGSERNIDDFCMVYGSVLPLFRPPKFSLGSSTARYNPRDRLPFLDDRLHDRGSSGEVYIFRIHEEFLDRRITEASWYGKTGKFKFARKVIKKNSSSPVELSLERDVLEIMSQQDNPNIIQTLFFYERATKSSDEISSEDGPDRVSFASQEAEANFVFPYIDGNLYKLLHDKWKPQNRALADKDSIPTHWLWTQILAVAAALPVIHFPKQTVKDSKGRRIVGFHFDLKPANILIDGDGILKITDFGQSLIRLATEEERSYDGIFRGGSLMYQPPEVCPTREEVECEATSVGKEGDHVPKVTNKYDVWSLGCIMLQVIIFIKGNSAAFESFESELKAEGPGIAFHNGRGPQTSVLKKCVRDALKTLDPDPSGRRGDLDAREMYMHNIVRLLQKMLCTTVQDRLSSEAVAQRLEELSTEFTDNSEPKNELKSRLKLWLRLKGEQYQEMLWTSGTENLSFIEMSDITVENMVGSPKDGIPQPCRILVLSSTDSKSKQIVVAHDMDNEVFDRELFKIPRRGSHFVPTHLFDIKKPLSCHFVDKESFHLDVIFRFNHQIDLMNFQRSITDQDILEDSDQPLQSLKYHRHRSRKTESINEPDLRIQIWAEASAAHDPSNTVDLPRRGTKNSLTESPRSSTSLSSSPYRSEARTCRVMVFLGQDSKKYINIPLYRKNLKIVDGSFQERVVDHQKSTSITFLPAEGGHKTIDCTESRTVPLSNTGFDDQGYVKKEFVEIKFRDTETKRRWLGALKQNPNTGRLWRDA